MRFGSSSGPGVKNLVVNIYKNLLDKQMKEKNRKQALLHKVYDKNLKRTKALDDVLTESDNLNKMKKKLAVDPASFAAASATSPTKSEKEFLEKFLNMPKGRPTHSIAENRRNHLTNFLSDYILNGFESGLFVKPVISDFNIDQIDSNGYVKNKYEFEISHIELMADLTALKIKWLISGIKQLDEEIEKFLEKCLKTQIRSTLTNERVISYVPEIVFIRDESKIILEKLDEHLLKIKIELEQAENVEEVEKEEMVLKVEEKKEKAKTKVDNLYGVEFTRLLESIKKSTSNVGEPWSEHSVISTNDKAKLDTDIALLDEMRRKEKFEADLRAFQINQRLKHQRLNKSAIMRIAQIEFENFRDKEMDLNNEPNNSDTY